LLSAAALPELSALQFASFGIGPSLDANGKPTSVPGDVGTLGARELSAGPQALKLDDGTSAPGFPEFNQLIATAETEPNNTPATADPIPRFGTGVGDDPQATITLNQGGVNVTGTTAIGGSDVGDSLGTAMDVSGMLSPGDFAGFTGQMLGDGAFGTTSGDFDFYKISLAAGEQLYVEIDTENQLGAGTMSTLDSVLGIYDASGQLMYHNDDQSLAFFFNNTFRDATTIFVAPSAGDYFIAVGGFTPFITPDMLPSDPTIPGTGPRAGSTGAYDIAIGRDMGDHDFFSVDLQAGDVLTAAVTQGFSVVSLRNPDGSEAIGSIFNLSSAFPESSPLRGVTGNATAAFVAPVTGTYTIGVSLGEGPGTLRLQTFRTELDTQAGGAAQYLYLDFDGATINAASIFGRGNANATLSPLSSFLSRWGLSGSDEDAVIDAIIAAVEESLANDMRALANNGDYAASGVDGEFDIRVLNSRDHADLFVTAQNFSRIIVGGTIPELGFSTIGIAESIDVGNFDTSETAVVLLDLLSEAAGNPNSLNSIPLAPAVSIVDLIGVAVGNVVAHEAGHYFGSFHTDQFYTAPGIMDQGGNPLGTFGVGVDGVFGSADDLDVDFTTDVLVPGEGLTGREDTLNATAFGLATGRASGTFLDRVTGRLFVTGEDDLAAGDTILVERNLIGDLAVTINGSPKGTFDPAEVTSLAINGRAGDDLITVEVLVGIPIHINGGEPPFPNGAVGDELVMTIDGVTGGNFKDFGDGSGSLTSLSHGPVTWSDIEIANNPLPPPIIIDDGDAGYSDTGAWQLNASSQAYNGDFRVHSLGDGSAAASWQFTDLTPGNYEISATWTGGPNRAANAPYFAFDSDGTTLLATALVNQQVSPDDFLDAAHAWEVLGVVTVTGSSLTVELSNAANGFVAADAIRIVETAAAPAPITIIDDGDSGFAASPGWNRSPIFEGRLNDMRYQAAGDGTETASWTFTGLTPGHYRVSATWTTHPNRATNAPFTLRDGTNGPVLETAFLNQELPPDDFIDNGSGWEDLAIVTISGTELVVELSNAANQYVIADAIRVEPSLTPPPPPSFRIIDDGDAGFSDTGWNSTQDTQGRLNDIHYQATGGVTETATWSFSGLEPGNYRVSVTWTPHPNRATNAPFTIWDGAEGLPLERAFINQELAPDDFDSHGSRWEDVATVSITGSELVVTLSNQANQFVVADAVRIERTIDPPPVPAGRIIDDGDAGFATTTGWFHSSKVEGHNGDVRYTEKGNGSSVATWTFTDVPSGYYKVSATWSPHVNRATNAPYEILDGGIRRGVVNVNQMSGPDDFFTFGSNWEDLMVVNVSSGTLTVELSNDADNYVIADAIRIEPTLPPPPVPIMIDGDFSDWDTTAPFLDAADDQHDTEQRQPDAMPEHVDHPDVDLLTYKVSHDEENFYFFIETTGQIGRTQMEDLARGLRAGHYRVIIAIDVDDDDATGFPLYEGGFFTGTTNTSGYDLTAELEFFNGQINTESYTNHGARNNIELQQAFADQSSRNYLWNGPATQGPFKPGFVNVQPGSYARATQWVYKNADPNFNGNDSVTFIQARGPAFDGNLNFAISADGTRLEMQVPFEGFLKDAGGNPLVGVSKTVDISMSLEATGELSGEVSPQNPNGRPASDTGEPISGYIIAPADDGQMATVVSHWTADNMSADAVGGNDAILVSGAAYQPGRVGQAFSFDGVDDRAVVADAPNLALTQSLTIEGWVRVDEFPTQGHGFIIARGDDRGGLDPYVLSVIPNDEIRFSISSLTSSQSITGRMGSGQFVHIAATLDNATGLMRLYTDGVLIAESTTDVRPFAMLDPASNPGIGIGNHGGFPGTPHNFPFHGLIDELRIHSVALTETEILAIVNG
jgi:hypothetical protein